jgi:pyruvate kinase
MINSGLDVARLNFSHGTADEHRERARHLREAADECGRDVGLLGDLQGPKIRVMRFKKGSAHLKAGASFFLDSTLGLNEGTKKGVGVALETLHEDVRKGDTLLLNDGLISLHVGSVEGTRIHTTVVDGGILSDHKGINLKGGGLSAPALTDIDRENIKLAAELEIDFLAVSFVRSGDDIIEARNLFEAAGGTGLIVAKIERTEAVDNIDSIIDAADVIMVARGDLGVEMGYAGLTGIQKELIRKTRRAHKIVITATQMMESMIENPIPTRAEVSDVANAVIDGTDAVMLSGETAVGKHPNKAIALKPARRGPVRTRRRGDCDGGNVHSQSSFRKCDNRAHRIWFYGSLDVASTFGYSDLRTDAARSHQPPRDALSGRLPGRVRNRRQQAASTVPGYFFDPAGAWLRKGR